MVSPKCNRSVDGGAPTLNIAQLVEGEGVQRVRLGGGPERRELRKRSRRFTGDLMRKIDLPQSLPHFGIAWACLYSLNSLLDHLSGARIHLRQVWRDRRLGRRSAGGHTQWQGRCQKHGDAQPHAGVAGGNA